MSDALPKIYLVRHGETAWTLTAQHTGRTDLPLNEQGERQARELEANLAALCINRVFSSPLQRNRRRIRLDRSADHMADPLFSRVVASSTAGCWDHSVH